MVSRAGEEREVDAIIIGAGLTGLVAAYRLSKKGLRVAVLEQASRVGGQIQTHRSGGFVYETGPNTGIISNLEIQKLFDELGEDFIELAKPSAKRRLILRQGRFSPLPSGAKSAVTTSLFTWRDKLRILLEPFRAKGTSPNETIAQLVRRRLGQSYLTYAVDPFVGGIYAGDPSALVTRHALPRLYALEQEYGSFIRGAIAKMRAHGQGVKPSKAVFSCLGGLDRLVERLAYLIGQEHIYLSAQGMDIAYRSAYRWETACCIEGTLHRFRSRVVISTVGSYALRGCFSFLPERELRSIESMRYAPIVQVAVGYRNAQGIEFDAFGGLIPSVEDGDVLGILNPTACFLGRAPEGGLLLSVFLGGLRSPQVIERTDEEIGVLVRERLRTILGIERQPDLLHIARHQYAIPQYEASTDDRLRAIEEIERSYRGLSLAGGIRDGIGMADRVAQAWYVTETLCREIALEMTDKCS
ncbi:MAG: protoporphyrinogen oxidase [Porphyromonadaceae bacterium]|nr:protoporphyrinogen oxidase [Porphyromonadaceae bacterium]